MIVEVENSSIEERSQINLHQGTAETGIRAEVPLERNDKDEQFYLEDKSDLNLIEKMEKVPTCTVLKYGLRLTIEPVKYYYCSCDPNQIYQICEECALTCHKGKGHIVKEQKEPAKIRCSCGEKVHNVNILGSNDNIYKPQCFFYELSKYSNNHFYFVNTKKEKICLFCTNFCTEEKNENKKISTVSPLEIPPCGCSNPHHNDINVIYSLANRFSQCSKIDLCWIRSVQLANLLIKCKDTYENIYSVLNKTFLDCDLSEKVTQLLQDKKIHRTNFFFAIKNFAMFSKASEGNRHFSPDLLRITPFSNEFFHELLTKDYDDSISQWTFLHFSLIVFKNITLGYHTRSLQKFKMFDLENMSVLQRLALVDKNKEGFSELTEKYINCPHNIIDMLISAIDRICLTRFSLIESYDVLASIVSILKYFANFYLFNSSQMINFCEELDKTFSTFAKIKNKPKNSKILNKIIEKESKLFVKIIKILNMFIYAYNDHTVLNLINSTNKEVNLDKLKFVQDKTELGRCIFRINSRIVYIISSQYSEENKAQFPIFNKILRIGTQTLNLFANSIDAYSLSMRKSFLQTEGYLAILRPSNRLDLERKRIVEFLRSETVAIEKLYDRLNDFSCNKKEILDRISTAIDNFFKTINYGEYEEKLNLNQENKLQNKSSNFSIMNDDNDKLTQRNVIGKFMLYHPDFLGVACNNNNNNNNQEIKSTLEFEKLNKYRTLLYDSNFIFTLVKIIKMTDFDAIADREVTKKIHHLLWFFVEQNRDNAILVLSYNIYNPIKNLPKENAVQNFELFFHCAKIISESEELSFTKHLAKKISNYMFSLPENYEDKYVCLNYFLKIMDIFSSKIRSLNYNLTLNKIKAIILRISENYTIINDFVKFMVSVTEDILYGRYTYFNIEDYDGDKETHVNQKIVFKLSENDGNNNSTKFTIYNSLVFNIFYLFLKITNKVYDSSNEGDRKCLSKLLKKEDLSYILKNQSLNLNIRTEIIKFYRKTNLDILTSDSKEASDRYVSSFIKQMNESEVKHVTLNNFPAETYSFYESLIKTSDSLNTQLKMNSSQMYSVANPNMTNKFDKDTHEFIIFELKNFKNIVESSIVSNRNKTAALLNYFEDGLVIPLNLYLKKIFSLVNTLTGDEFLNVYEIFPYLLKMKKYFIEKNMDIKFLGDVECTDEEENNQSNHKRILKDMFRQLKGFNCSDSKLAVSVILHTNPNETLRDLERLKSKFFPAFDYTSCHSIVDVHHFSMIQKSASLGLENDFSKVNQETEEKVFAENLENINNSISSLDEINLYKISIFYENRKGNLDLDYSALAQCLPEVCLEYETTYRTLLLKYLIFLITKNQFIRDHFSHDAYFILFKLLQYHTNAIQLDLEKVLEEEYSRRHEEKKKLKANKEQIPLPMENSQNYEEAIKFLELKNDDHHHEHKKDDDKARSWINFFEKAENKIGFLNVFGEQLFNKLISIFITDFNPKEVSYHTDYIEAYNLIKIFKFLCEDHNNFFQGSLIKKICFNYNYGFDSKNNRTVCDNINFFDLMLLVLNNILMWSNWGKGMKDEEYHNDYLFDIFSAIIELLIEIIQGNTVENLSYLTVYKAQEETVQTGKKKDITKQIKLLESKQMKSAFQIFMENINKGLLFHDGDSNAVLYKVRTQLMDFLLAILEEKNCSIELKNYLIENLSLSKVTSSMSNTLKLYFLQKTKDDKSWASYKMKYMSAKKTDRSGSSNTSKTEMNLSIINNMGNKKVTNKDYKLLKFDSTLYNYFYDQYFVYTEFPESPQFEFANTLYRYIKMISIPPYFHEEANNLIEKMQATRESDIIYEMSLQENERDGHRVKKERKPFSLISHKETSFDPTFCEEYFIIKFFEQITQMVEVCNEEGVKTTVIFTVLPTINYLSNDSKKEFQKYVNRENQFTKTYDLVNYAEYFKLEIQYNSNNLSKGLIGMLKRMDYGLIQVLLYIWAFIINIFIFAVLEGDTRRLENWTFGSYLDIPEGTDITPFKNSTIDPKILYERHVISNLMLESIHNWAIYYYIMTMVLIALCGIFIMCYLVAKVPLYYEIELLKYCERHKVKRNEISLWKKFDLILFDAIIGRDHINSIIFLLVSGIVAVSFEAGNMEMFFSFMTLTIVNINPTLKNITVAVRLKYKELLTTLGFTFILIYAFSNIGFYFFKFRFGVTLDLKDDNYCESLLFCFLTHSNQGFRIEGSIGDTVLQKVSFQRSPGLYAGRLLYDFIVFCIQNILMRELVFGIIIESFKELRVKETLQELDKKTKCFICGVTKDELEKDRIDFTKHCEKDHNIENYINYMMRLKFSDPQNLNAINSFTLNQIEKKYTNWIPKYESTRETDHTEGHGDDDINVDLEKYNEIHNELPINKN